MAEVKNSQVVSGVGDQGNTNPLDYPNGMQDPNYTSIEETGAFEGGRTKIKPTDMSGVSGQPTGASYDESLASQKAGGKVGVGTIATGDNDSGIPAATPITPLTYGDPNNSHGGSMPSEVSGKL